MNKLRTKKGFTLIELMIVVAIIGILAAIAIPQFAQLISKSQEGATKGNLGTIRSSLSIYYGDTEGTYPIDPSTLTVASKYLQSIPPCNTPKTVNNPGHGVQKSFALVNLFTATGASLDAAGVGGLWAYDNTGQGGSTTWGNVVVSCSHSDLRGSQWTAY